MKSDSSEEPNSKGSIDDSGLIMIQPTARATEIDDV